MKKLSAAAFAFGLLSVSVSQALAADATVNFSGTILQEACSVDTSDNTVNVQLGTYGAAQFPTVGTTTLPVPFAINLTGCPASGGPTAALVTFSGAADAAGDLALTAGGASGAAAGAGRAAAGALRRPRLADRRRRRGANAGTPTRPRRPRSRCRHPG